MVEMAIIGGGIQGTLLSLLLTESGAIPHDRIAVIDPHDAPLWRWKRNCAACHMPFLRSPATHCVDIDFGSLLRYAQNEPREKPLANGAPPWFIPPHRRPALSLFNRHAAQIIDRYRLDRFRFRGTAMAIRSMRGHLRIALDSGSVDARRALIATGRSDWLRWPDHFAHMRDDRRVCHLFDPRFSAEPMIAARRPIIIGMGISAVQFACWLAHTRSTDSAESQNGAPSPPLLLSRSGVSVAPYDSDPCYLGPKCMPAFLRQRDLEVRRRIIDEARNPGSLPPEIARLLQGSLYTDHLAMRVGEIVRVERDDTSIRIVLADNSTIVGDCIALATGFDPKFARQPLVAETARINGFPVTRDGHPILLPTLEWRDNIFVSGGLAELELGPAAQNIIGAHLAARRLVPAMFGRALSLLRDAWRPIHRARNDE